MARTALEMTQEELKQYSLSIKTTQRGADLEEALKIAKQAADLLRRHFGARKVVIFGSMATRIGFSEHSDIDLAAWGIPMDAYYRAVAAVTGLSDRFKIDLVDPETCRESIKNVIQAQGLEI